MFGPWAVTSRNQGHVRVCAEGRLLWVIYGAPTGCPTGPSVEVMGGTTLGEDVSRKQAKQPGHLMDKNRVHPCPSFSSPPLCDFQKFPLIFFCLIGHMGEMDNIIMVVEHQSLK